MRMIICFLFLLIFVGVHSQEPALGYTYFKYDNEGLHPREFTFEKDSLSAAQLYNDVKSSLENTNKFLADFKSNITNIKPNESFTFKGEFSMIFCVKGIVGPSCKDGSFEIDFIFRDGSYTMKPVKLKSGTFIELIPIEGRAIFYEKDGSLKKQFITFPVVVETMLNWIAFFSNYTPNINRD